MSASNVIITGSLEVFQLDLMETISEDNLEAPEMKGVNFQASF